MDAQDRIDKVKTALIIRQPFFGVLCSMLPWNEESRWCPTMATDGMRFYWNREFVNSVTDSQLMGVMLHEVFHVIYLHCDKTRVGSRDRDIWGMAVDYVVNLEIIDDVGYQLTEGCLYDTQFKEMTAEQVYDKIKNDPSCIGMKTIHICSCGGMGGDGNSDGNNGPGGDSFGQGGGAKDKNSVCPKCGGMGGFDVHVFGDVDEAEIREKVLTAFEAAKSSNSQGTIPAGIQRLIKDMRKAKVRWEKLFHRFVGSAFAKDDYSFTRPNRRFDMNETYMPSLRSPIIGDIVFAVDTSGSMGDEDLAQIVAELKKLNGFVEKITVMSCDAAVHEVVEINKMEDVVGKITLGGGGGTDFRPVFDEVQKRGIRPEVLIYATDTYGTWPDKAPQYPVMWVSTVTEDAASKCPWGYTIYMNNYEQSNRKKGY